MPQRLLQLCIAASLTGTLAVGIWLRWWLAGVGPTVPDFGAIRHLHTHLGYYGVLFPLMWLAWSRMGVASLGTAALGLYVVATIVSAVGFGLHGYGPIAIAGSTAVLGVWIWSAWRARGQVGPLGRWLATAPLAIVVGAAIVPFVAMNTGTERAAWLVRSFLGMLMLGALLPTALAVANARHFPPLGWFVVVVAAGLSLGAVTWMPLRAALLVVGLLIAIAGGSAPLAAELRVAWVLGGSGMVGVGMGLLDLSAPVAVAGTHFLVLGPLLLGLWPWALPRALQITLLVMVSAMCTAILAPAFELPAPAGTWAELTAISGSLLAAGWLMALVVAARQTWRDRPRSATHENSGALTRPAV